MEEIEYKKMYEAEESHWWYVGLHELILYFVGKERAKRGPLEILDAGCGTGRLCQLMNEYDEYGKISGCDISSLALELCTNRNVSAFKVDLNHTDLGTERYVVITSIDVLYHKLVHDDQTVLSNFYRALKPGGILILNLPAFNFLKSRHDQAVHTRDRYTKSSAVNKLKEAGFIIDKVTYRLFFLFPFIALYRLTQRRSVDERGSDVRMPPMFINKAFLGLTRLENLCIERDFAFPFGTSLFIAARKPA